MGLQKYGDPVSESEWEGEPARSYGKRGEEQNVASTTCEPPVHTPEEAEDEDEGAPLHLVDPLHTGVQAANKAAAATSKSSQFVGVSWNRASSTWEARLRSARTKKKTHIGTYAEEHDAARAYDHAAVVENGPLAKRNFPDEVITEPPLSTVEARVGRKASNYLGVSWDKKARAWAVHRWDAGSQCQRYLGCYASEEDAARAYDFSAVQEHGPDTTERNFMAEVVGELPLTLSAEQQHRKTSNFLGVSWLDSKGLWRVRIRDPTLKRLAHIGYYATEEEAARAYDWAALNMQGHDAKRNFPHELVTAPPVSTGERRRERKTSKYLGVSYHKGASAWRADLWDPQLQRRERIGSFASEEEAARAYDYTAFQICGPNAKRNFAEPITEPPLSLGVKQRAREGKAARADDDPDVAAPRESKRQRQQPS
ncbi:hypothetical protein FOA52_008995 [Chlamydomonas sp. UWO 241]|nr:hypothetical protein FOA52_008995 [Chlamydomonas sp. UWO 241]